MGYVCVVVQLIMFNCLQRIKEEEEERKRRRRRRRRRGGRGGGGGGGGGEEEERKRRRRRRRGRGGGKREGEGGDEGRRSSTMITTFALKCHTYFPVVSSTVQILRSREPMSSLPHSLHDQEVLILHTVMCLNNDCVLSRRRRRRDVQLYLLGIQRA